MTENKTFSEKYSASKRIVPDNLIRDPMEEECEAMIEDENPYFGGHEED